MDIVVCSDNHGLTCLDYIRKQHPNASAYIHCGDSSLPNELMDGFVTVKGNNDFGGDYPLFQVVDVYGTRIYVEHRHDCGMDRYRTLYKRAKEEDCSIVCFGHIHHYVCEYYKGMLFVNPGSLLYNRDDYSHTYAIIHVNEEEVTVEKVELNDKIVTGLIPEMD